MLPVLCLAWVMTCNMVVCGVSCRMVVFAVRRQVAWVLLFTSNVRAAVPSSTCSGGLGDVMAALPKGLRRRGHRMMVVSPRYGDYKDVKDTGARARFNNFNSQHEVSHLFFFSSRLVSLRLFGVSVGRTCTGGAVGSFAAMHNCMLFHTCTCIHALASMRRCNTTTLTWRAWTTCLWSTAVSVSTVVTSTAVPGRTCCSGARCCARRRWKRWVDCQAVLCTCLVSAGSPTRQDRCSLLCKAALEAVGGCQAVLYVLGLFGQLNKTLKRQEQDSAPCCPGMLLFLFFIFVYG